MLIFSKKCKKKLKTVKKINENMKNSTLVLIYDYYYFFKYINYPNLEKMYNNYEEYKMASLLKKIMFKFKIPVYSIFLGKWKKDIRKYSTVIIFDSVYSKVITRYIKKKNENIKIILYLWNRITQEKIKFLQDKNVDEFWTFDIEDSKKYKLQYNQQFYTNEIKLSNNEYKYDALFLGRPKERKNEILQIKKKLEDNKLKTNIVMIEKQKDYVNYDDYLNILSKSRSVIDVTNSNQIGLTLRPLEALFFRKKLITNNKDIINYDFYNSDNIFIIGIDDESKIREFINKPYKDISQEIIDYYDYKSWLERFKENSYEFKNRKHNIK